jgi:hypothetical protein
MRAQLHAGDTLRIRYAGAKPSSTQGRAWRTVRIIVGPHEDYNYTHGPVVTVKDLSDPAGEHTKTLYIHRIIDAEGLDMDSGSDGEEFAEDDLVTIARQDNRDGVTMGRVVGAFEGTLRIKDPVSQRLHTVLRKHCRKTSVTQMRRKEGRAKAWTRRRQGIGAVVS